MPYLALSRYLGVPLTVWKLRAQYPLPEAPSLPNEGRTQILYRRALPGVFRHQLSEATPSPQALAAQLQFLALAVRCISPIWDFGCKQPRRISAFVSYLRRAGHAGPGFTGLARFSEGPSQTGMLELSRLGRSQQEPKRKPAIRFGRALALARQHEWRELAESQRNARHIPDKARPKHTAGCV